MPNVQPICIMRYLEWLGELPNDHPPCIDRIPGEPPLYQQWPFDEKNDTKYLTAYREPVRSAAHWVPYKTMVPHYKYSAGAESKAWRNRFGGLFLLMEDGVLLMLPATSYLGGIEEGPGTTLFVWPTDHHTRPLGRIILVKDLTRGDTCRH